MALDYRPGYSRYLEGLSEPFVMRRELTDKRRKDDEYKRQNDLAARRLEMQDQRAQQEHAVKTSDRNRKVFQEISDLVQSGRMTQAEAYAATAQYQDPKTGELRSLKFSKPEEPSQAPTVTPRDSGGYQTPNLPAPVTGSAGQRMNLRLDPVIEQMLSQQPPAPRASRSPELASVDEAYPRRTRPSVTTPDGRTIELDPEEGQRYKQQQAEETAARLEAQAANEPDPVMRMASLRAAERIRAALPGNESAQLQRVESQRIGQDFSATESEKNRQLRRDLRPARGAGPGTGIKAQKAAADLEKKKLDIDQEYWDAAEKPARMLGFVDVVKQRAKLEDMTAQIAGADNNAALAAIVAGSFTKYAQGGVGVLTDNDIRFFWKQIGGLGLRTEQMFHDAIDGKLGPDKQRIVSDAMQTLLSSSNKREMELGKAIATSVSSRGEGKGREYVPTILQTLTPRYYKTWQEEQAGQGDVESLDTLESEIDARMRKRAR